jgi:hypothetical protein
VARQLRAINSQVSAELEALQIEFDSIYPNVDSTIPPNKSIQKIYDTWAVDLAITAADQAWQHFAWGILALGVNIQEQDMTDVKKGCYWIKTSELAYKGWNLFRP